jgi:hypothetical protein
LGANRANPQIHPSKYPKNGSRFLFPCFSSPSLFDIQKQKNLSLNGDAGKNKRSKLLETPILLRLSLPTFSSGDPAVY